MNTADLVYRPEEFRREYVETGAQLRQAADTLCRADAIGVDLEMGQRLLRKPGGVQEWQHILALIQIASNDLSVVIDPLRCGDLSPLRGLMAGHVRKVFLGGGQDAALLDDAGIPAHVIVDVGEAAYAVFGRREDGMAALSKRIFGLNLDKTIRRADWLVRPLNPALVAYAHQDAELTLLIYRWFQLHFPDVVRLHERDELEPSFPASTPEWLRDAVGRGSGEAGLILAEYGLDPEHDASQLTADIHSLLQISGNAPRRVNRLVRIAADLGLRSLLPDVLPLADSPSSLLRASAARAVGKLAEPEAGQPALQRLKEDPIEDVRKAADAGLRDLRKPKGQPPAQPTENEVSEPTLGGDALAALQELMQRLGEETG